MHVQRADDFLTEAQGDRQLGARGGQEFVLAVDFALGGITRHDDLALFRHLTDHAHAADRQPVAARQQLPPDIARTGAQDGVTPVFVDEENLRVIDVGEAFHQQVDDLVHQRGQIALGCRHLPDCLCRFHIARPLPDARHEVVDQTLHLVAHIDKRLAQLADFVAAIPGGYGQIVIAACHAVNGVPKLGQRWRNQLIIEQRQHEE